MATAEAFAVIEVQVQKNEIVLVECCFLCTLAKALYFASLSHFSQIRLEGSIPPLHALKNCIPSGKETI